MKKPVLIPIMLMILALTSCSLRIRTSSYGHYQPQNEVKIIQSGQQIPENAIRIGSVETSGKGLTPTRRCSYASSVDAIIKKAKKMGGNIIYIVSVKEPTAFNSCYRVTADVYLQIVENE
jgi:hypothetical protein